MLHACTTPLTIEMYDVCFHMFSDTIAGLESTTFMDAELKSFYTDCANKNRDLSGVSLSYQNNGHGNGQAVNGQAANGAQLAV
jgi:hypothetical protein